MVPRIVRRGRHSLRLSRKEFSAIAITGGGEEGLVWCYPCGVCRQVMAEFCDPDSFEIICGRSEEEYKTYTLRELLPKMF